MSQLQFLLSKANKLKALVSQMERHNTLNQSDMPLVCGILLTEMHAILCAAKNLKTKQGRCLMEKCFIVGHTLGSKKWYLVESQGVTLSTPLDSIQDAMQWLKSTADLCPLIKKVNADQSLIEVELFSSNLETVYEVFHNETGVIERLSVKTLIDSLNSDRSSQWSAYDRLDWIEGLKVFGDYTVLNQVS